ncbi:hypothetical protein WN51_00324 [Melipona quadrifasciata]|uniref:Uncharacterized protein n=1 Tax=Melipona quadrifasciata TaxID=166423 RepID=A0A0M9A071_9HYME|nr:hypothetical protein WN51_00324 [Melipona quadrifasciata]
MAESRDQSLNRVCSPYRISQEVHSPVGCLPSKDLLRQYRLGWRFRRMHRPNLFRANSGIVMIYKRKFAEVRCVLLTQGLIDMDAVRTRFDDLTEENQQLISEERRKARNHPVVLKLAADKAADQTAPTTHADATAMMNEMLVKPNMKIILVEATFVFILLKQSKCSVSPPTLETTVISVFVSKSLTIVDKQDIGFLCSQDAIVAPSILLNLSKSNILSRIPYILLIGIVAPGAVKYLKTLDAARKEKECSLDNLDLENRHPGRRGCRFFVDKHVYRLLSPRMSIEVQLVAFQYPLWDEYFAISQSYLLEQDKTSTLELADIFVVARNPILLLRKKCEYRTKQTHSQKKECTTQRYHLGGSVSKIVLRYSSLSAKKRKEKNYVESSELRQAMELKNESGSINDTYKNGLIKSCLGLKLIDLFNFHIESKEAVPRAVSKLFICIKVACTLGYPISREEVQLHCNTYYRTSPSSKASSHRSENERVISNVVEAPSEDECYSYKISDQRQQQQQVSRTLSPGMDDHEIQSTVESILGPGVKVVDCEKKSTMREEEVLLINGVPIPLEGPDGVAIREAMITGQVPPCDLLNQILVKAGILSSKITGKNSS